MKLSGLQKYIILQCFDSKNKLDRKVLLGFYGSNKKNPSKEIMVNSITNSIERLIKKGLIVGFGEITKEKVYINKIRLTRAGQVLAKKALGEQRHLPFKAKF
ncbi:MAG: hypothetical protein NTZ49_05255 [Candidatus Parcubacteria bacterium]|nr:hypothetical protein [Candidatus Parcubacteria bacterium]